jgi:hypothetical protein
MKQLLEVTLAFEVEVELPGELDASRAPADLRTRLDTRSLTLMQGSEERPTRIVFQTETIRPPFRARPDEFRCDSCRGEFSNDDKCITSDGDELCGDCMSGQ